MHDLSNIRPVSVRELLARAATHLQMVDREAVIAKDAQHIGAAHSLLDLLLITEPVSFMPARPVESVPAGAGGNEVDALRDAAPDLLNALKQFRTKVYNAALGSGMDDEWATLACSVADAAIAKASGDVL